MLILSIRSAQSRKRPDSDLHTALGEFLSSSYARKTTCIMIMAELRKFFQIYIGYFIQYEVVKRSYIHAIEAFI